MQTKQDALKIIQQLIVEHAIEPLEVQALYQKKTASRSINSFLGFIGAILIFTGLGVYIGQFWNDLSDSAQIIITLGSGLALFAFAMVKVDDPRYVKTFIPIVGMAVVFETVGLFVTLGILFPRAPEWHNSFLLIFALMALQLSLFFNYRQRSVLLFFLIIFGLAFAFVLLDKIGLRPNYNALTISTSMLCITYGLSLKFAELKPNFYFFGSAIFLLASFNLLQNTPIEIFFIGLCSFFIYLSTLVYSRVLLLNATIAMIVYIGYLTEKYFVKSMGWPLSLIVLGMIMIYLSRFALQLSRKINKPD